MNYILEKAKMSLRVIMTELERPLISLSVVSEHRNLDCARYDQCLDLAVKKNWKGFSCSRCPIFKAYLKERKKLEKEFRYQLQGGFYEEGFV